MKARPRKPNVGSRTTAKSSNRAISKVSKPSRSKDTPTGRRGFRECIICATSKPTGRNRSCFPQLESCNHEPLTCTECFLKHITVTLESHEPAIPARMKAMERVRKKVWALCSCPQCGGSLTEKDLFPKLSADDRDRLDRVISRKTLESHPHWVWCSSAKCRSGQLHDPKKGGALVTCSACGRRSCFFHAAPWHKGYTCAEFDRIHPLGENSLRSEALVKEISKQCPGCKRRVERDGGCNHMYCIKCYLKWDWDRVQYDV
ncbi:hypothetical protein VTN77DRAFT_1495 [Rasamsonia byssochlamydoides]|uniref:uncharacterized protein n=1 Tax=Rasamsonia byssochlamydoides TaxID=89139 RepID=UPI0037437CA0